MELTFGFQKELLEFLQKKSTPKTHATCMHAQPQTPPRIPSHSRHPISLPSLSLLSPFPFHLPKNISLPSTHLQNSPLNPNLPPPVFHLSAFSYSRQ